MQEKPPNTDGCLETPTKLQKLRKVHNIVGRASERCQLEDFLADCIQDRQAPPKAAAAGKQPKALYISGGPGTGKTCSVRAAVSDLVARAPETQLVEINCMLLQQKTLKGLMTRIVETCAGAGAARAVRAAAEQRVAAVAAQQLAKAGRHGGTSGAAPAPIVLVLDEVDQLVRKSGGQAAATAENALVLEGVFSLPTLAVGNQRMAVIAIANAVDLLEQPAARELIQKGVAKSVLFEPYTTDDLRAIFKFHLSQSEHGKAAEEALGRIGLETRVRTAYKRGGSCRTLLGYYHQVVKDIATASEATEAMKNAQEAEALNHAFADDKEAPVVPPTTTTTPTSPSASSSATLTPNLKAPPKSNQNDPLAGLKEMPTEQQIMLCALASAKTEVVKMTDICQGFRQLLTQLHQPTTLACKGNVAAVLTTLEVRGLVELGDLKSGRPGRTAGAAEKIAELSVSRKALKRSLAQANELLAKYIED